MDNDVKEPYVPRALVDYLEKKLTLEYVIEQLSDVPNADQRYGAMVGMIGFLRHLRAMVARQEGE